MQKQVKVILGAIVGVMVSAHLAAADTATVTTKAGVTSSTAKSAETVAKTVVKTVPVNAHADDPLYAKFPQDPKFVLHIQSKKDSDCYSYIVKDSCFEDLKNALADAGFDTSRLVMPGYHKGQIWIMPVKGYDKADELTSDDLLKELRRLGYPAFLPDQSKIRDTSF